MGQMGRTKPALLPFTLSLLLLIVGTPLLSAHAEVRTVTASGEYRMGDRDTREDAVRLATEAAKRNVLEQIGTFLESVTTVTDLEVTGDEIRTYTAGMVSVVNQKLQTRLEGDTVIVHVDLKAQVDPDEVAQAIAALRQNEDAKSELIALRTEVEQLHQALEEVSRSLTTVTTPEQVLAASQQRQQLLNQVQANALVAQAWTDWAFVASPVNENPSAGVVQVQGLLAQAGWLYPASPHVRHFQQVLAAQGFVHGAPPLAASTQSVPFQQPIPSHQPIPQHQPIPLPPSLYQIQPPSVTRAHPYVRRAPLYRQGRASSGSASGRSGRGGHGR